MRVFELFSRQVATGLAFSVFGGLGIFFQFLIFPGIVLIVRDRAKSKIIARHVIHVTQKLHGAYLGSVRLNTFFHGFFIKICVSI